MVLYNGRSWTERTDWNLESWNTLVWTCLSIWIRVKSDLENFNFNLHNWNSMILTNVSLPNNIYHFAVKFYSSESSKKFHFTSRKSSTVKASDSREKSRLFLGNPVHVAANFRQRSPKFLTACSREIVAACSVWERGGSRWLAPGFTSGRQRAVYRMSFTCESLIGEKLCRG